MYTHGERKAIWQDITSEYWWLLLCGRIISNCIFFLSLIYPSFIFHNKQITFMIIVYFLKNSFFLDFF